MKKIFLRTDSQGIETCATSQKEDGFGPKAMFDSKQQQLADAHHPIVDDSNKSIHLNTKSNLFNKVIIDLMRRREDYFQRESRRKTFDEVISQGYDNNVINAMLAFRKGAKKIQITNESYLEWDEDYQAWSVILKKELGHVGLTDEEFVVDTWNRIRNLETDIHYFIRDKKDEYDIFKIF